MTKPCGGVARSGRYAQPHRAKARASLRRWNRLCPWSAALRELLGLDVAAFSRWGRGLGGRAFDKFAAGITTLVSGEGLPSTQGSEQYRQRCGQDNCLRWHDLFSLGNIVRMIVLRFLWRGTSKSEQVSLGGWSRTNRGGDQCAPTHRLRGRPPDSGSMKIAPKTFPSRTLSIAATT
jgi:hypothetical protein